MPIEIKELCIKVEITKDETPAPQLREAASGLAPAARKQLIADCLEAVMQRLDDKLNR